MTSEEAWKAVLEHWDYLMRIIRRKTRKMPEHCGCISREDVEVYGLMGAHAAGMRYDETRGATLRTWMAQQASYAVTAAQRDKSHHMGTWRCTGTLPTVVSLSAPIGNDEDSQTLEDRLSAEDLIESFENADEVRHIFSKCPSMVEYFLTERAKGRSLLELAKLLGVSEARVCQIRMEAMEYVRSAMDR